MHELVNLFLVIWYTIQESRHDSTDETKVWGHGRKKEAKEDAEA